MSAPHSPMNPDSTDLDRLHAAVRREKADLEPGREPAPLWVMFLFMIIAIIAGGPACRPASGSLPTASSSGQTVVSAIRWLRPGHWRFARIGSCDSPFVFPSMPVPAGPAVSVTILRYSCFLQAGRAYRCCWLDLCDADDGNHRRDFLYGVLPTLQPAGFDFGRVYAAYGGVFVVMSVLWGWRVDGIKPDAATVAGAAVGA